jgi:transposase
VPALDRVPDDTDREAKPATADGVSTDPPRAATAGEPSRSPTASACEPYRDLIERAVRQGRNAMAIWQDLVDDHRFPAKYASVKRFVGALRGPTTPEARVVIETGPGEETQVDYGEGPMVRYPATGKYRRTRLFVLTLGCSRKSVRLLVWKSSTRTWAELHEQAFRRLGGTTRVVVLDNLREGVLTPDIYDPTLNPLYRDVLAHYGVVALPCRVGDPDRKGKVESGVGHAQKTPLQGLRFETLEEAQAYLDRWESHWADTRIHGTTKRQVAEMFAEERPSLQPLPVEPFRYYEYATRTVNLDGCIEVKAAYYSAPTGWIGRDVLAQWNDLYVRLVDIATGRLLREHVRTRRGHHRIEEADRPARTPKTTLALLAAGHQAGERIGQVCDQIHQREGQAGVRRILGVLALAKKYGGPTVDEAARAALDLGVPTYRFLRRYLERRPPVTLRQIDPLIRQLSLYRDLIDRRTGERP